MHEDAPRVVGVARLALDADRQALRVHRVPVVRVRAGEERTGPRLRLVRAPLRPRAAQDGGFGVVRIRLLSRSFAAHVLPP